MAKATDVKSILTQVSMIQHQQNEIFVDRLEEIRLMWIALIAMKHMFIIGKPGVSKSMLVRDTVRRILGYSFFGTLMRKETTVAELFGPLSITALKQDRYEHNMVGHFGTSDVAFLDELFKASSGALNSTLTALNERIFKNGAEEINLPLVSCFAASNEYPQGEELAAIYDRFLLRMHARDLESDNDFLELLVREPDITGKALELRKEDLTKLQEMAAKVEIPVPVKEKLVELRAAIKTRAEMSFGPRRWVEGLDVVRAEALLQGRTVAEVDDLAVYQHMLWDTDEERKRVGKVIMTVVNPLAEKLLELIDLAESQFQGVKAAVDANKMDETTTLAVKATSAFKRIKADLEQLDREATATSMKIRIKQTQSRLQDQLRFVTEHGLGVEATV